MEKEKINTLEYEETLCNRCGFCLVVCPHGVFEDAGKVVKLANADACMECGACELNCAPGAIKVDSGVGCASAMIRAALTGGEPTCGCEDDSCCG
jgi:NAD-dependent dihydropyrimidine dehydrogenase PreA subunit